MLLLLVLATAQVEARPPSPSEHFGFAIGDDYQLANYSRTEAYFRRVAASSDRFRLVEIGRTSEGRPHLMLIASSPANLARLEEYRGISARLARARDDEAVARQLASAGKAVVWIDGGLHATETVGSHQLIETVWQLASRDDAETLRILDDTIVLLVHANPDGQELIADWYMREPVANKRVADTAPRMYQKYAGHDNNRDFYMAALQETRNLNRVAYTQWYPQILYNHHQSSPTGTVIVIPPYRDPFNYAMDAMVPVGLEALGAAMNTRFLQEAKPGAVSKGGSVYSTWWNGGLRTTPYFHNMLGVLTEITGSPTPMQMPFLLDRQLPDSNLPLPVPAQRWHFRQSIDYSLTANWAILDYASRHREPLLFNIWRMGRNSIERGSRDHWTARPSALDAARAQALAERKPAAAGAAADAADAADAAAGQVAAPAQGAATAAAINELTAVQYQRLYAADRRDPRGYILPADQADFPTAVKFVNALLLAGVEVERAERAFEVAGKGYPAGSYVVRTAQAFRPHVLDMFEPQDHPHDVEYPGGPPVAPYDSAGWTLALQMGVAFDRILDGFDGPFAAVPVGELQSPPAASVAGASSGYLIDPRANDSFTVVNRVLKAGVPVQRLDGEAGMFHVPSTAAALAVLGPAAAETGVAVAASPRRIGEGLHEIHAPRIALWDQYGGSMVSGWTRLVLESFGFDYEVVYPQAITAGGLRERFDVLILPSGAFPAAEALAIEGKAPRAPRRQGQDKVPAAFQHMLGELDDSSLPALRAFLDAGGHIIATGSSTGLALSLGLPIRSHLRKVGDDGRDRALRQREYYIPGSVLSVAVDTTHPVAMGLPQRLDLYFSDGRWDNAPVFDLPDGHAGIRQILWFDGPQPLRSGWALGQEYLDGGVLAAQADIGEGRLLLLGTDVTFRAQSHGAFKLLFNGLLQATTSAQ
ncbi:M14 family metallopeptidase [Luteimonas sp. RIT-PG2_3]